MDVFDVIYCRRSISKFTDEPVPTDLIEKLLSAAVQAPNHYRVQPWRFFVLRGDALNRLGDAMAEGLLERQPDVTPAALDAERARPLRAPLIIAVAVEKPVLPKELQLEDLAAASAATQNLLLAAHALGLGAIWRTGPAATSEKVKAFFGLEPDQHLLAMVYIGFPITPPEPYQRPGFREKTTWL